MIASVGCTCMFLNMEIRSRVINFVAMTTFGVYLIHCNQYMWMEWIKALKPVYMNSFAGVIGSMLIIYFVSAGLDLVIRYGIVNPLHKYMILIFAKVNKEMK